MIATPVLFDTNILIDYLNGIQASADTLDKYRNKPAISVITWMEVMVGAKNLTTEKENETRTFLAQFTLLPVTDEVAEMSVIIRHNKMKIKLPDAIILATAKIANRKLVSRNPKDFDGEVQVIMPYTI